MEDIYFIPLCPPVTYLVGQIIDVSFFARKISVFKTTSFWLLILSAMAQLTLAGL